MATLVNSGLSGWTARATTALGYPAVAYSPTLSRWVAVSYDIDAAPVMTSDDGGVTWAAQTAGVGDESWVDVIWVASWGLFIACCEAGAGDTRIMTSPTGLAGSWTNRATPAGVAYFSLAHSVTLGIAVALGATQVITSSNGTVWTGAAQTGTAGTSTDMVRDDIAGRFVAVGDTLRSSADGIAWSACTIPASRDLGSGNDRLAVGASGVFARIFGTGGVTPGYLIRSTDGITFTDVTIPASVTSLLVTAGSEGPTIWLSGINRLLVVSSLGPYALGDIGAGTWIVGTTASGSWYNADWDEAGSRVVVVGIDNLSLDAMTATFSAIPAVTGLTHLEGKSVSVVADGVVLASPNNPAYTPIVVTSGTATLPAGSYATVSVGLPFTSDIGTLDIEQPSGSRKDTGVNVTKLGLWMQGTRQVWGRNSEPTSATALTDFQPLPLEDEHQNVTALPITGYREIRVDGAWNNKGGTFLRTVDPTPTTILAIIPQGHL